MTDLSCISRNIKIALEQLGLRPRDQAVKDKRKRQAVEHFVGMAHLIQDTDEVGGERCMICNRLYCDVWKAPEEIWLEVAEYSTGLLCMNCFDALARAKGTTLYWSCDKEWRP